MGEGRRPLLKAAEPTEEEYDKEYHRSLAQKYDFQHYPSEVTQSYRGLSRDSEVLLPK